MTHKKYLSGGQQHHIEYANGAAEVMAAIEIASAEAIDSIRAAGVAARGALECPQPNANELFDQLGGPFTPGKLSQSVDIVGETVSFVPGFRFFHPDTSAMNSFFPQEAGKALVLKGDPSLLLSSDAAKPVSATTPVSSENGWSASDASTGAKDEQVAIVPAGGGLELSSPFSGAVSFEGATGVVRIDCAADFTGKVIGQLAIGDVIDLPDVMAGATATLSYSGNNSPGTLTVSDGVHVANIALTGNYSLANFTASSDGHGGTSIIDPPVSNDGSAGAPGGTPQFASILNGYTMRPSWEVAGVDYAVGITPSTVLKDPGTIHMAGVSVDASTHQIVVTGSNLTLDGYDFSLSGGWSVITQAANTTISNSNFKIGSNGNFTIYGDAGSSGLTVKNCVIDGDMLSDKLNNGLIYTATSGLTVEYSLLKNAYSDFIQAQGGGQLTIKYNVLNNNGNVGAHPDWLQTLGNSSDPFTESVMYNTVYQTMNGNRVGGTQGFMLNDNGAIVSSAELAYNTIIALPGAEAGVLTTIHGNALAGLAVVHDNFADSRGGTYGNESFFANDSYSPNAQYYNNTNMVTGGIYYQNVNSLSETDVAGHVNQSVAPVSSNAALVPTVAITSEALNGNVVTLQGQASSNVWLGGTTVQVSDGGKEIGSVNTDANGAWSFTAGGLASGTHNFSAEANNFFGYVSAPSQAQVVVISGIAMPPLSASSGGLTPQGGTESHLTNDGMPTLDVGSSQSGLTTGTAEAYAPLAPVLNGTADVNSTINVFDGPAQIGAGTASGSHDASAVSFAVDVTPSQQLVASGDPQLPNLFSGYAVRPPWQVAGVDYAVGVPAGLSLKDPSLVANIPPGVSVDSSNHIVNIFGNNVTLDGFDFSLDGGWTINVHPGTTGTTTIENCNFSLGANQAVAIMAGSADVGNLTVLNCSFDGNQLNIPSVQPPPLGTGVGAAIAYNGNGSFIAKYNYIHDMPADGMDLSGGSVTPTIEYNVFKGLGYTPGAHPDPVQFVGDVVSDAKIAYNTIYQPQGVEPNEGLAVQAQLGSTITNTTIANNVIIATGPNMSMSLNIGLFQDSENVLNGVTVANNYVDPTGTFTSTGFGDISSEVQGSNLTIVDNVNLVTGQTTAPTAGNFLTTDVAGLLDDGSSALSWLSTSQTSPTDVMGGIHAVSQPSAPFEVAGPPSLPSSNGGLGTPDGPVGAGEAVLENTVQVAGIAEAGSTINLYEGSTLPGTVLTATDEHWNLTTAPSTQGEHILVATTTDAAGNTSQLSHALDLGLGSGASTCESLLLSMRPQVADAVVPEAPVTVDGMVAQGAVEVSGTAEAGSTIRLYEGLTLLGTGHADGDGLWNVTTSPLKGEHILVTKATDAAGIASELAETLDSLVESSGSANDDSTQSSPPQVADGGTRHGSVKTGWLEDHDKSVSSSADATFAGNGGTDTFVFAPDFGHDVIADTIAKQYGHHTIDLSKNVFDSFAAVLAHASQAGGVVTSPETDTFTLKSAKVGALDGHNDFHFG